jgi:hypothetical protein
VRGELIAAAGEILQQAAYLDGMRASPSSSPPSRDEEGAADQAGQPPEQEWDRVGAKEPRTRDTE